MSYDPYALPDELPVPEDDGAAAHLTGLTLPDLELESSQGTVNVRDLDVLYVYPKTGRPGIPMPSGWDETPGARGCTPQSCGFRDAHGELRALGKRVAGLSMQPLEDQIEFAERNAMPFPVVADPERRLGEALGLPTFEVAGETLYDDLLSWPRMGTSSRSSIQSSRPTRTPATSWPGCARDEARHLRRGAGGPDRRRGDRRPRRADDAGVVRARRLRRDRRAHPAVGGAAARADHPEEVLPHGRQLP